MRALTEETGRQTAALRIQERLAEARHNEMFGWGAVVLSALLVLVLTFMQDVAGRGASGVIVSGPIAPLSGPAAFRGLDVAAALMLLAAILVVLGVAVSLYCRFLRTRLFDELLRVTDASVEIPSADKEVME